MGSRLWHCSPPLVGRCRRALPPSQLANRNSGITPRTADSSHSGARSASRVACAHLVRCDAALPPCHSRGEYPHSAQVRSLPFSPRPFPPRTCPLSTHPPVPGLCCPTVRPVCTLCGWTPPIERGAVRGPPGACDAAQMPRRCHGVPVPYSSFGGAGRERFDGALLAPAVARANRANRVGGTLPCAAPYLRARLRRAVPGAADPSLRGASEWPTHPPQALQAPQAPTTVRSPFNHRSATIPAPPNHRSAAIPLDHRSAAEAAVPAELLELRLLAIFLPAVLRVRGSIVE